MFQTNMWCYLWDLVDEGIGEVLDRLKGEAGVTGISVATCYHSIDQIRPHPAVSPKRFRSSGGAQFQPQTEKYAGTRIRPVTASWLKKSNPLNAVVEACDKRGLNLRAWTVCCHGSYLVGKYENCAVKNIFGDIDPTWLCPVNPDVREYLRAMVEDLSSNYPFEAIELERPSFQEVPHSHAHYKIGFTPGEVGHWLMNLCFCESCRQVSKNDGIDIEAVVHMVQQLLEKIYTDGEPPAKSIEECIERHPILDEFTNWRCSKVASLVETIKRSCQCRIIVHRAGNRYIAGTDFTSISPHCDAMLTNLPHSYTEQIIDSCVKEARQDAGDIGRVELGLWPFEPYCADSATLVRAASHAAKIGVRSINIYNYGMLPLNRLEWIRQAVRYAQREAT